MGAVTPAPPRTEREVRLGTWLASMALVLLGLAASVYLTIDHYRTTTVLACPENSVINCAKVTSSSWSKIGPVPVALLGTIYFAAMALLCTPQAWRLARLDMVRIEGAAAGVVSALYFIWVELFRIDAICLWCSIVHAAAVGLLGSVLWTTFGLRTES